MAGFFVLSDRERNLSCTTILTDISLSSEIDHLRVPAHVDGGADLSDNGIHTQKLNLKKKKATSSSS